MVKHTKRRSRGGAYISKGTYGCAFAKPPLKCKDEPARRNAKQLSKVLDKEHAESEYAESEPFKRMDPKKEYFIWSHHKCGLDFKNIKSENRMEKCIEPINLGHGQYHQTVNIHRGEPTLLFYEFGGKDLSSLQLHYSEYAEFFKGLLNLLRGLVIMHDNEMVHNDIKPPNIVGKKQLDGSFSMRFIDFGLSKSTTRIDRNSEAIKLISNHWYWYYPFDFRFLWAGRGKPIVTSQELSTWYQKNEGLQLIMPQFSYWDLHWSPLHTKDDVQSILSKINYSVEARMILEKVDVFSLGVSFAEMFTRLVGHHMWGGLTGSSIYISLKGKHVSLNRITADEIGGQDILDWHRKLAKEVTAPFHTIVYRMTYIDPHYRSSAFDAFKDYQKLMPKFSAVFNDPVAEKALKAIGIPILKTPGIPTPPPAVQQVRVSDITGISEPASRGSKATNSTAPSEPRVSNVFNNRWTVNIEAAKAAAAAQPQQPALGPIGRGRRFKNARLPPLGPAAPVAPIVPAVPKVAPAPMPPLKPEPILGFVPAPVPAVIPKVLPVSNTRKNKTGHFKIGEILPAPVQITEDYFAAPSSTERQNVPILTKTQGKKGFFKRIFGKRNLTKTRKQRK